MLLRKLFRRTYSELGMLGARKLSILKILVKIGNVLKSALLTGFLITLSDSFDSFENYIPKNLVGFSKLRFLKIRALYICGGLVH